MSITRVHVWEQTTFPDEQKIDIPYPERLFLVCVICRRLGLKMRIDWFSRCCLNEKQSKEYYRCGCGRPRLPDKSVACSLGRIYHEAAHQINQWKFATHGHGMKFKQTLIRVYKKSQHFIDEARVEARQLGAERERKWQEYEQSEAARKERERRRLEIRRSFVNQFGLSPHRIEKRLEYNTKRIKRLKATFERKMVDITHIIEHDRAVLAQAEVKG